MSFEFVGVESFTEIDKQEDLWFIIFNCLFYEGLGVLQVIVCSNQSSESRLLLFSSVDVIILVKKLSR